MSLKVEQRVGIAAPVDEVYAILADIESWPQWSPIHKAASGQIAFGAAVRLEENYAGLGTWEQQGVVADYQPLSHIHVSVPKRFYAGTLIRYFEMDILSETGTSFSVGALFGGFLSQREGKRYRSYLREGFAAFAEALKTKAEAETAAHPERVNPHILVPELPPLPKHEPAWRRGTKFWGGVWGHKR
ncbi:SRPBCC domain-containing protein [Asticcacaulis sp. EMRT-3]|uniref:SRPBCC domain-containing protein n=1 Tax=Asticcacaulis sp. EMRT-3 TaxID=3040349 RepID=UPI0024AF9864|nr:SRPBCC domain-containing protein [Asticcacaulis sp. EMRT-3]MDI7773778.1 SRPBCC domain-containing protein [Asticcacaulis sp. EMRT-3]